MTKLHLTARAPNEGARRLARWIMREFRGDLAFAAQRCRVGADQLQRVVAGELVPGEELALPLGVNADIGPRLWRRPAASGWFDPDQVATAGQRRAA